MTVSMPARRSPSFACLSVPAACTRRGRHHQRSGRHLSRLLCGRRGRLRGRLAAAAHAPRMRRAAGARDVRGDAGAGAPAGRPGRQFDGDDGVVRRTRDDLPRRLAVLPLHRPTSTTVLRDQSLTVKGVAREGPIHWRRQLWGTGARAPLDLQQLNFFSAL